MDHRILVIDDEPDLCAIIKLNLMKDGYKVDCAYSAEEALTLDLTVYSLLIVDINMDRMNGIEFAKCVNDNLQTKMMPIMFCTANDTEDDKLKGFDVGADDYITKPFDLTTLRRRVKSVLSRSYKDLD